MNRLLLDTSAYSAFMRGHAGVKAALREAEEIYFNPVVLVILNSLWRAGTPIPANDIWIAASAMEHGLRLITTDAHYQRVSQVLLDYFPAS